MRWSVNIKKGDMVEVVAGKDTGKRGEVLRAEPKSSRVVIQGVNQRKKHQRAHQMAAGGRQTAPEILVFDAPLHVSNVVLVCPKCRELTKVTRRRTETKTVRICRKCNAELDA
jgi:large subunit ribosomal protein L24